MIAPSGSSGTSSSEQPSNDLAHLPSIMTRTSRQQQQQQQQQQATLSFIHHHHHHHHHPTLLPVTHQIASSASKPSLISAQAISTHTLPIRTNGFADLAFIDFSCKQFPRMAQNLCELWPRTLGGTQEQHQPLHNYRCSECGFYFPCRASLELHERKKRIVAVVGPNGKKGETATCPLFMVNSKWTDYERTVDEIISKIEEEEKKEEKEDYYRLA